MLPLQVQLLTLPAATVCTAGRQQSDGLHCPVSCPGAAKHGFRIRQLSAVCLQSCA